jgi:hypothetical protein
LVSLTGWLEIAMRLDRTIPTWSAMDRVTGQRVLVDERTFDPAIHRDKSEDTVISGETWWVTHPVANPADYLNIKQTTAVSPPSPPKARTRRARTGAR